MNGETEHLRDKLLTVDGLGKLPPSQPLINDLLYNNTLAQLSGGPGTYKTFLAVTMACCVATGEPFGDFSVPESGTVIYVAAEGASGLQKRILGWCEVWEVDPNLLDERLFVLPLPIQLGEDKEVAQVIELVQEKQAVLTVLDTRARCTLGLEENNATQQGWAIEAAESIRREGGCCVTGVHHTSRSGTAGRGSNAWDGAVWSDLRVTGTSLQAKIHCEKHKDEVSGCDHQFSFRKHTVAKHLMPTALFPEQRKTLVMSRTQSGLSPLKMSARRLVLGLIWEVGPPEGFAATDLLKMVEPHGVSRSSVYEALKWGVDEEHLSIIGTERRSRWTTGEKRPSWLPENH